MLTILQNDPEVPLGNYADALTCFGVPWHMVSAYRGDTIPSARDCSAVVVLGGAMSVHDTESYPFLQSVKACISQCLQTETPYLGLCLGGQLLADLAGGQVVSHRWEEQGVLPVDLTADGMVSPLFHGVATPFPTFQWHHDSFDLPIGGVLLASSPICRHQAFSLQGKAFGLQFHPEMVESVIADWCRWTPATAKNTDRFLSDFAAIKTAYMAASWKILENFLRIAGVLPEDQA